MTLSNKFTISLASLAILGLLAACSNQTTQTPASSASLQQVASSASSSKASQTASQAENLDGTYKGTDETDQITLTISGTTGTWEELEREGEKESKPVTILADNHTLTVGDDLKYYRLEGNQLTIEDDDRNPSDTIVLTK
ncbi:MAG: SP_0198 family lipoprotein [Streptococcus parasanguinis]|nr:SP_0198 family lipoprotein [Streptococcus parasanguinis]MDU1991368.1 SP_0198 family lipoprotein [Streptococcus parasanguinis]